MLEKTTTSHTNSAVANYAAALAADSGEATRRRPRRPNRLPRTPRKLTPRERLVLADGRPAVLVELTGASAQGRSILLDPDVWQSVKAAFGPYWYLVKGPLDRTALGGVVYGCSAAAQAWARAAGQKGRDCRATLARIVIGLAGVAGKVVRFRNGDTRDLRRDNLLPLPRKSARSWQPDRQLAAIEALQ